MPGYPRAANVSVEGNKWTKTVNLSWNSEIFDSNNCNTNGTWIVFRKNLSDNTVEVVGSDIGYNTRTFTDDSETLDYNTPYTYNVCFVPNGWIVDSWTDANGLWASKDFTLLREYQFRSFVAEGGESNIELNWEFEAFTNASNSNSYQVVLQRGVNSNTTWTDVYTQTVNSSSTKTGSYTDNDVSNPCNNYIYRLMVQAQDATFYSVEKVSGITGTSKVVSANASRGTYNGRVRVTWEAEQHGTDPTYFKVNRRPLGSGDNKWVTLYSTNGTATSYDYQDDTALPGEYYEYQVVSETRCESGGTTSVKTFNEVTDGFCIARGVVSGRVSYGTGTSVKGVRVSLKPSNDSGKDVQAFYSLRLQGVGEGVNWPVPSALTPTSAYTLQFYMRAETDDASRTANAVLLEENGATSPLLQLSTYDATNQRYQLILGGSASGVYVKPNEFTQITLRYDGSQYTLSTYDKLKATASYSTAGTGLSGESLHIGYSTDLSKPQFQGYLDEIRIYSHKLTDDEIPTYADHTLAGTEDGLLAYIPLDEGIQALRRAYDYSKTAGAANENHGELAGGTFSTVIPDSTQLGLLGYTDIDGNYVIRGVPFNGEGTNYSIIPYMGVHKFSPTKQSRYLSASSMVHSGVDFEDVSSFPVRGTVYYKNTTYPVEGVSFAVDGVTCTREGNIITTDADGNYEISVPIGDHYITMSKVGHTFENNGRYPANPDDNSHQLVTFDQEVSNLTFYDTTLVPIAGRVVGGATEAEKPLGFGESDNNIGQAQIVMTPTRNNVRMNVIADTSQGGLRFLTNPDARTMDQATNRVNSPISVGGGDNNCNNITITTDATSGEFAVMVPPVEYSVSSITIPSQPSISFDLPIVDATSRAATTDSIANEQGGYDKFEYYAKMVAEYDATPTFTVTQVTANGQLTAGYGDEKIAVDEEEVPMYTTANDGTVTYNYGYPIFKMFNPYFFKLKAYEEYKNQDDPNDIKRSQRPLSGYIVTIGNELSTSASVKPAAGGADDGAVVNLAENQLELDSLGEAIYPWMAGCPNIISPYYRTLTITYGETGTENPWSLNPFKGIVLGELPTGNNYITKGPAHIDMILRDPGGSGSQSWFEKEHAVTKEYTYNSTFATEENVKFVSHLGVNATIGFGLGEIVLSDFKSKWDLTTETTASYEGEYGHTYSETTTTTDRVSTSDDPDFVGHDGDLFMGRSTNLIWGDNKYLHIEKNNSNQYVLNTGSIISLGQEYATKFVYTEKDIIENEIPKLERLRNSLLKPTGTTATDKVIYVTDLTEDDEDYGQEGTYEIVVPTNYKQSYNDEVMEYNSSIDDWKQVLANNEMNKVKAINNRSRYLKENVSFSTGVSIEHSSAVANDTTHVNNNSFKMNLHLGLGTGVEWNGNGVDVEVNATNGGGFVSDSTNTEGFTETYGYILAETGTTDALSVDVFDAPDGFGPIFVTRAGQTSCPYEDEVKTRYYKPDKYTLSAKTMKVEDPDISAESTIATGVPSGKAATFSLILQNKSEVDEDAYFNVGVVPGTNQQGAALWLNQLNITEGAKIFVEAGKKLNQTLTLTQSDLSVLDYEGIQVFLQSDCDDSQIDYVTIEAHFQPACTDINFAVNNTIINGNNPNASVTLTASGYDKSFSSLQAIKLQMRSSADNYWTTLATYNASQTDNTAADYIPDNGSISYVYNMQNYTDGTYVFRAVTECSFSSIGAIEGESNEVAVVKDTHLPALIAMPSPSDGVLDFGDEISATFNEDIQKNLLSKADNFFVRGVLNGAEVTHDVALNMTGTEAAQTEARIDLSARDFTFETWLNWSEAGTLLQHGSADNNMSIDVDNAGHLAVKIGNETYTSSATIPSQSWVFVAISYDYDADAGQGMLSARYAKDADEVLLLDRVDAATYTGNGTLTVGKSIKGQAHELTLWNTSRQWAESLSEMYTTKSNYTEHLIGYWPLSEGHGNAGEDRSRSRNLTVADNAWYIYGDNYSLQLNGSTKAAADISDITTENEESYEVEAWFRIDTSQSGAGSLMKTGTGDLALNVNAAGALELAANGNTYAVGSEDYRDGQWHHVALNVLKSTGGNAAIYVDGAQKRQLSASQVPPLQAAQLVLGENLKGAIDEVRIWKGRRTSDVIKQNMYARVAADEPGLVAYYPMEETTGGTDGQIHFNASLTDLTHNAKTLTATSGTLATSKTDSPPIQALRSSNNVDFNFTASERKILIDLDAMHSAPAKLEGCTVLFTLSGVRDMQNNISEEITWSAYIRQNQLRWSLPEVSVRKLDDDVVTFDVDVVNRGGTTQNWVISNLPTWLTVSNESGTLEAQASKTITFTVDAATAIGRHEADIYLTGDMNIHEVLVVNVTSAVTPPDWTVNSEGYESTMNVVGQLQIDGTISEDGEDIVAAFRGNECVGLANPIYLKKYDAYYLMMSVYGNADDSDVDLTFKVFDASTGTTYPQVATSEVVRYNPDYIVGTFANPIVFNPQDAIEQTLALTKGWTWTSIYVTPTDNTLNAIFKDNGDEVTYVKDKSAFAQLNGESFVGSLTGLVVGDMYKVNATTATTTSIIGTPAVPTAVEMSIAPGWNWIGYNCSSFNSLENAFADLSPVDGDIVKSQGPFSIYDDGEWVGNLQLLNPGQGYCYWSEAASAKTFHYPNVSASTRMSIAARRSSLDAAPTFVNTDYEGNMSIIAIVKDGDMAVSEAQVTVVSGNEVRGYSAQAVRDDIHFVSVAGKSNADKLQFVVTYNGFDYLISSSEYYQNDAVLGSLKAPYILNLDGATGIQHINVDGNETIYDMAGRKLELMRQPGVYIVNGRKVAIK